ncbi:MAG TPA: HAD-IA family hydrolase, partial [Candidatus Udaeobacter sp.]|nr:HAD-IA family hydrolase [Candidatus Udaeobacter sp.]
SPPWTLALTYNNGVGWAKGFWVLSLTEPLFKSISRTDHLNMKKVLDVVMFDLDGTLADTGRDLADAVNHTRAHFDLSPLPDSVVHSYVGRGVERLLKHSLPEKTPDHFLEVMRVFLDWYENHLLDATVLYPNVHETLDYFCKKRRAVVTNKMVRLTVAVLRGLDVEKHFDAIVGGDSGPQKKPDPALLNYVLDRFQLPAARALMVGDGDTDIEAGKRAGVLTCGVTYGLRPREELVAAGPDILIDDLAELSRYFC